MALVDLTTGRTCSFRACAIHRGPQQPVTLIDQTSHLCPVHGHGDCVETFHSTTDLASIGWRDLWRMRRRWKRTCRG
jgi:hypothetical protein